jgi:hypothetical protein
MRGILESANLDIPLLPPLSAKTRLTPHLQTDPLSSCVLIDRQGRVVGPFPIGNRDNSGRSAAIEKVLAEKTR